MKGQYDQVQPIFKVLVEGLQFLLQNKRNKTKSSITIAHHMYLIQNVLAVHGNRITEENVHNGIINLCAKTFPN